MKKTLSVKIPEELKDWLYEWSEQNNVKVSSIIKELIEYLRDLEDNYTI